MKKLLILLVVLSGFVSAEGTTRELGILKEGDSFTLSGKTEKFLFIPYYKLSEASFFVLPINIKPEHITPDILDNKKFSGEERWKLFSFISCQKYHYFSISLVHHLGWGIPAIGYNRLLGKISISQTSGSSLVINIKSIKNELNSNALEATSVILEIYAENETKEECKGTVEIDGFGLMLPSGNIELEATNDI